MKFRKKPVVIEATQWYHPQDNTHNGETEGEIVRYYRHPSMDSQHRCEKCLMLMHDHGWIDTLEGGHVVCVGDWIITGTLVEKQQEVILSVQQTSAEGSEKHEWCKEALALTDETMERLGKV